MSKSYQVLQRVLNSIFNRIFLRSVGSQSSQQAGGVGSQSSSPPPQQPDLDKKKIEQVIKNANHTGTMLAAFIPTVSSLPLVAAFMSVTIYLILLPLLGPTLYANFVRVIAVGSGTLGTILVWTIVIFFCRGSANVNRANIASFEGLIRRLTQIASWQSVLNRSTLPCPDICEEGLRLKPIININKQEVCDTFEAICCDLQRKKNTTWSWATGYINLWKKIHQIDESFIYLEQRELVIHDALHDEMSLKDSTIDNRDELLKKLRTAVIVLSADAAAKYLNQPEPQQATGNPGAHSIPAGSQNASNTAIAPHQIISPPNAVAHKCPNHVSGETQARVVICEVRQILQQFRDDRWEKLVRVRNHLLRLTILTAICTYILLEFAIIAGVTPETLKAITAFFLTGTIVGLFSRLYDQSKSDASLDDFRLSGARAMAALIFSGLAAIGGILVQKLITTDISLSFSLSLPNVLIAAAFGLTPSIFVTAIQQQADQYKSDLKSTQAPSGQKIKA